MKPRNAPQIIPKIILVIGAALLVGCAGTRAPVTQQVDVPVAVSCVKSDKVPAKPVYEFDKLTAESSDGAKVLALANDWPRARKYEGELEAVIAGCK
ncbi:hypothetical protein GJ699_04525 [Duganella sp. FT80W]|uniref:Lipoprotein n=1 Tax=Duganella guangzhouensis TaxID=2666084 RepID=A0A6I2KU92_9BURK|nr:hypothetical protein [Duganella guangzhouensis]MRW89241.1 hypothetical protein [Duganella guangzhouensis]